MSAEAKHIQDADDDLDTTAPQSKPDAWKMPEPVFRRTSGRPPRGFEETFGATISSDPEPSNTDTLKQPTADVPDTSDAGPETKNPTVKLVLVLLGLAAMVGFISVFLTVLYFFLFRSTSPE